MYPYLFNYVDLMKEIKSVLINAKNQEKVNSISQKKSFWLN